MLLSYLVLLLACSKLSGSVLSDCDNEIVEQGFEAFYGNVRYDRPCERDALVHYVNTLNTTWRAAHSPRFIHVSHKTIHQMMGVNLLSHEQSLQYAGVAKSRHIRAHIPESFDSREEWPMCNSIREVRDQSACGSCWAFGAVEAMTDRICVATEGRVQVHLSADDLLSCCSACGYGCDGGEPLAAFQFWVSSGIVTGSNYTAKSGCRPYPFPPCEHHSNRTHFKPCNHDLYPTPRCEHKCITGYGKEYRADKFYGRSAYHVEDREESIQKEIMTHGPVEAAFEVYEDLLTYKSGVYKHVAGKLDGGHAVKMVGWGVDNGEKYWLIANSWNTDWGLDGFFKIARGNNECGIESQIVAGAPKLSPHYRHHHNSILH